MQENTPGEGLVSSERTPTHVQYTESLTQHVHTHIHTHTQAHEIYYNYNKQQIKATNLMAYSQ